MSLTRDARRRWLGMICLAIAIIMLVLGQTVLKAALQRLTFVFYWLICTLITGLTLLIALLDMRAVRRRSRQEEKELIHDVFREITEENVRNNRPPKGQ